MGFLSKIVKTVTKSPSLALAPMWSLQDRALLGGKLSGRVDKTLGSAFKGLTGGGGAKIIELPQDPDAYANALRGREIQRKSYDLLGGDIDRFGGQKFNEAGERQIAKMGTERQVKGLVTGAEDRERQAKSLVAQRGLGGTSTGLSTILGAGSDLRDQASRARAMSPALQNQAVKQARDSFETQRLNRLSGLNQLLTQNLGATGMKRKFVRKEKPDLLGSILGTAGGAFAGQAGKGLAGSLFG